MTGVQTCALPIYSTYVAKTFATVRPFGIQIDDGTLLQSRADEPGARLNPFAHTRSSSRRRMKAEMLDENLEAMVGATPTRFCQTLVDSDAFIASDRSFWATLAGALDSNWTQRDRLASSSRPSRFSFGEQGFS